MKEFFKGYNDMCVKPQLQWLKKHWKGYTLICVGAFTVPFLVAKVVNEIQERNLVKNITQENKTES